LSDFGLPQKHTFGQQEKTMKKNGKCKKLIYLYGTNF
jgi:hypothetical protein